MISFHDFLLFRWVFYKWFLDGTCSKTRSHDFYDSTYFQIQTPFYVFISHFPSYTILYIIFYPSICEIPFLKSCWLKGTFQTHLDMFVYIRTRPSLNSSHFSYYPRILYLFPTYPSVCLVVHVSVLPRILMSHVP